MIDNQVLVGVYNTFEIYFDVPSKMFLVPERTRIGKSAWTSRNINEVYRLIDDYFEVQRAQKLEWIHAVLFNIEYDDDYDGRKWDVSDVWLAVDTRMANTNILNVTPHKEWFIRVERDPKHPAAFVYNTSLKASREPFAIALPFEVGARNYGRKAYYLPFNSEILDRAKALTEIVEDIRWIDNPIELNKMYNKYVENSNGT